MLLSSSWSWTLEAQRVKSTLSGAITDPSGATVAGAEVVLTNTSTGIARSFTTLQNGMYAFPFLDPGTYSITTKVTGFKTAVQKDILVRVAADQRVDMTLELGEVTQTVEATAVAAQVESVSSTLGTTVDNKKVADLPLNGRNIYALLNIIPGSSLGGPNGAGIQATNPVINGTRPRGNSFTVDGVGVNQENSGTSGGAGVTYQPQLDAIAEFRILTSNYSAEYGRAMGGVVSLSLKSGTNQFHGSLFEYLRNDKFDARNFFAAPTARKPVLRYNQFGVAVGGPIIKNRLFFFSNAEWTKRRSQSVTTSSVPTAQNRTGDFSTDPNRIYDILTTRTEGGRTVRDQFPGNIIPANRIDASSKAINDYYPLPTSGGLVNNFVIASPTATNAIRTDTKIDYVLSSRDTVAGRYSWSDNEVIGSKTFPGPANPNTSAYQDTRTPGFQVNWTHTFSPRLISEFRTGYQRFQYILGTDPEAQADWRSKLGLPAIHTDPTLQYGFPYMAPSGITAIGATFAQYLFQTRSLQFNETVSWSLGRHFVKFGGSFARIGSTDRIPGYPAGGYVFSGQYTSLPGTAGTGRGFADYLLGLSSQANAGLLLGGGIQPKNKEFALFLQDDFRLTKKLTLNLGLRYDLATAIRTDANTLWGYDPAINATRANDPPAPANKLDVAPRFGFAYQLTSKTVLRGGYGVAFFPQFKGLGGFFASPPVQIGRAFPVTDPLKPAFTLRDSFGAFVYNPVQGIPGNPNLVMGMFNPSSSKSPYVQSWSLTIERQLAERVVVRAAYVGNKGTHLEDIIQINQLFGSQLGPDSRFGGLTAQQRRPFPLAGQVQQFANDMNSNYHSLQLSVDWLSWKGLSMLSSFTRGKAIAENRSYKQDNWNRAASRGLGNADLPRAFVQSATYELPFGAGRKWMNHTGLVNQFIGGWQVNGILTARDGFPIHITSSSNLSGSFSILQFPDRLRDGNLPEGSRTIQRWFDTSAFKIPDAYTFGNSGAFPGVRGPGLVNLDFSLFKRFRVMEGKNLEFRAESFNISNTPGFANPNAAIGTAAAGSISALLNANRSIQFALKFLF